VVSLDEEVEERIREERMQALWQRGWPWFLGLLIAVLVGFAGWQFWQHQSAQAAGAAAESFMAAQQKLDAGDLEGAQADFTAMARSAPTGYRAAATMQLGAIAVTRGAFEEAIGHYEDAAGMFREPLMRDQALLKAAYLAADREPIAEMEARLNPLIERAGDVSGLAQELLAAELWEAGQVDRAREIFNILTASPTATEGLRQRARLALAVIGPAAPAAAHPGQD